MPGSGLPAYGPETPSWLKPRAPITCSAELGQDDNVVALALLTRTPVDPESAVKGTLCGVEGVASGYLKGRRPWADEAGTSDASEEDPRFPTLVDLMVRHGGSTDIAETLLRGIKECSKEELQYWGPGRIRLRDPVMLEEPLLEMDDREEVEKWEHVKELRLWMKHALGLTVDIIANDLN